MTTTLPPLLTTADLALAELHAARLDGDLYRLDDAFCSVAEFDLPWRRALALRPLLLPGLVVAGVSALWVWGGLATAPLVHEAVVASGGKHPPVSASLRLRSWNLGSGETVEVGEVTVTTPERTVVDLLRSEAWPGSIEQAVRDVVRVHRLEPAACSAVLEAPRALPHRIRSRQRLAALFDEPPRVGGL